MPDPEYSHWFAEEVLPHQATLRGWLRARFPALDDSEDVAQEAVSRLLQARRTGPVASPKAFLFVTARNLALNRLRHLRVEWPAGVEAIDCLSVLDDSADVAEAASRAEDFRLLMRALQALPTRCRQVMTLRKIYGLSQKEVAAQLGISVKTVEVQGAIGLRKCIEYFRRHGYNPPVRP